MSHASGPWASRPMGQPQDEYGDDVSAVFADTPDGRQEIATVFYTTDDTGNTATTAAANAELIAAAPAMARALVHFLRAHRHVTGEANKMHLCHAHVHAGYALRLAGVDFLQEDE